MRTKQQIYISYLKLLNEEKQLGYTDKEINAKVNDAVELETVKGLFDEELYSVEEHDGQIISTKRAFYVYCKCCIYKDVRSGREVWNNFIGKQFEMAERNAQACYMAHRGSGKSFFFALYVSFKMYLLDYYDVCYTTNVPRQKRRWFKTIKSLIDSNELLLDKKDVKGVSNRSVAWGLDEIEYNGGVIEGTTIGTTPKGGHYSLVIVDDILRDDKKYTTEYTIDYIMGILKPTTYTKKARYVVGGCVIPKTKIITENGLENIGDQIKYDEDNVGYTDFVKKVYGKDGWDDTSKFYVNGKSKTKKIILENGFEIECTHEHPLWVCLSNRRNVKDIIKSDCRWINSDRIQVGDKIAIKIGTHVYGKSTLIDNDFAYLMGLYLADGSIELNKKHYRITISNKDEYCTEFITKKYGFIKRDWCHYRKSSKELVQRLDKYGLKFETSSNKDVPKQMFMETKEIQTHFLKGLFDGDGCSNINEKGHIRIFLTSTSKNMIHSVQLMLLNMGIMSSITSNEVKGHYERDGDYIKESFVYNLVCSGYAGKKFLEDIGFNIEYKQQVLDKKIKCINNCKQHFGFIWRKVKHIFNSENYTVDFVIPKTNSFISNGIVSHNTPIDAEDLFFHLMNGKIDKNGRPIGKIVTGKISAPGFYSDVFPAITSFEKKEVLVPEIWTFESLMAEKERVGDIRFSREMLCLKPSTKILTDSGYVQIKNIGIGDKVITHKNNVCDVKHVMKRYISENIISLKSSYCSKRIDLTKNHPVYVLRDGKRIFIEAQNLKLNDYLVFPIHTQIKKDIKEIELSDFIPKNEYIYYLDDNGNKILSPKLSSKLTAYDYDVILKCKGEYNHIPDNYKFNIDVPSKSNYFKMLYDKINSTGRIKTRYSIHNNIHVDDTFLKICGLYIAEGTVNGNNIIFSLGEHEKKLILWLIKSLSNKFNRVPNVSYNRRGAVQIRLTSKLLCSFFKSQFGHNAINKCIPYWIMNLPFNRFNKLLKYYLLGDGCLKRNNFVSCCSISEKLMIQIREILLHQSIISHLDLNVICNSDVIEGRLVTTNTINKLTIQGYHGWLLKKLLFSTNIKMPIIKKYYGFVKDKYLYSKVSSKKLFYYKGIVHNIEVDRDNSYSTFNTALHNCKCSSYNNSLIGAALFRSCCDSELTLLQGREKTETGKKKKYIIAVDSATSDAPTADYCAITVWEDDADNKKFILRHVVHEKGFPVTDPSGGTDDQTNVVEKLYNDFNQALIIIEKNNAGIALIQALQARGVENIIEHYTNVVNTGRVTKSRGKADDIIDYIEYGLKAGVVVFPSNSEDIYTIDAFEKVKSEHLNFGVKKGRSGETYEALAGKDDIFDSCWIAFKYRGDMVDTIPMGLTYSGGY